MNMEAKEKAEELVLKYLRIDNNTSEWFNTHIAKQCALIAIDEIIKENYPQDAIRCQYWLEVKHEVSLL